MKEELIRAAYLYYIQKLNQQEIAEKMAMSRQRVGRLLRRAEEEGVVEIRVHGYSESCAQLEETLCKKLGLDAVRIVDSEDELRISEAALDYVENRIEPECSIGVAFGHTTAQLCRVQRQAPPRGIKIVQLLGGLNAYQHAGYRPDEVATRFAQMFGGEPYGLFIPAILKNPQLKKLIYAEEQFQPMLERIAGVDMAVITAGALHRSKDNILTRDGYLSEEELERLVSLGCVGNVCLHFIDLEGKLVDPELDERIVGITAEQLKRVPVRICVAYGPHKLHSIIGAAQGGFLSILVTNRSTAQGLLDCGLL